MSSILNNIENQIASTDTDLLQSLDFAAQLLPQMPHQAMGSSRIDQKAIDADTLRWTIQMEMDRRGAGEIPYTWEEMYAAMGIPKEFLE